MAQFALTIVASDNSASALTLYLNPENVISVGDATSGDISNFSTALCAVVYQTIEQNTPRLRRYLTASSTASVNAAISAAAAGVLGSGVSGDATLVAGTVNVTIPGLTTNSKAVLTRHTAGGTVTSTVQYFYAVSANTLTITAAVAAGTINTADTSVVTYAIVG